MMNNNNNDRLDKMLRAYFGREQDAFTYKESPKKRIYLRYPSAIAAALVIIMCVGFVIHAFSDTDNGFIIVANAQTLDEAGIASADEITSDAFVEIKSESYPIVEFDFDCILDPDAKEYDLTQKYLFQSINMNLNLDVVGENIETVTYKTSKGTFAVSYSPEGKYSNHFIVGYDYPNTEYTIDYDERDKYHFTFNPVYDSSYTYERITKYYSYTNPEEHTQHGFCDTDELVFSEDSDELNAKYSWVSSFGSGYKSSAPTAATEEEIEALRAYAKADDMVGFFNYQNKIFERIINDITIDITVTKTDGSTQTKTLELCYTPDEITSAEGYLDDQTRTYSTGTISTKLK